MIGEVYYIQARHFDKNRQFDFSVKPDLERTNKIENHLLQKGDVLLAAKGNDNFAIVYRGRVEYAVASSMFLVIRLKDQIQITPNYLAWFLNYSPSQQYFQNSAKGTSISAITKKTVEELEIFIPSLDKQNAIVNLEELRKQERSIKSQIEVLKETNLQYQILNAIK